ncbi:CLUMA_CG005365, isoform A [Clunio marinus]|uniref:CLUMA_CG005365, isoform A n=1 Tax=Clunio marinus TaxID=568069 RepID=A0A1J1HW04_9DIPT|nr:CLUMA_CG005365, isoform A [Clunio marinus]
MNGPNNKKNRISGEKELEIWVTDLGKNKLFLLSFELLQQSSTLIRRLKYFTDHLFADIYEMEALIYKSSDEWDELNWYRDCEHIYE